MYLKKISKTFLGGFKNDSMKFCFAILLLHGSHRSYPSRRRACLPNICLNRTLLKHKSLEIGLIFCSHDFNSTSFLITFHLSNNNFAGQAYPPSDGLDDEASISNRLGPAVKKNQLAPKIKMNMNVTDHFTIKPSDYGGYVDDLDLTLLDKNHDVAESQDW